MALRQRLRHPLLAAATALLALCQAHAAESGHDEEQIYAEALNQLAQAFSKEPTLGIVVSAGSISIQDAYKTISQPPPSSLAEDIAWRLPKARNETIAAFVKNANAMHPVKLRAASLRTRLKARLVPKHKIDSILQGGYAKAWRDFDEQYPDARYIIQFSAIGFDASSTEAIVYMQRLCPGLCGAGELILLQRRNGGWSISQVHQFWIA